MGSSSKGTALVHGEEIARYGFGEGHPFGPDRHGVFMREVESDGLLDAVVSLEPREATVEEIGWFHSPPYIELVRSRSRTGEGYLDAGDTPAMPGIFESASSVVGAALVATEALMRGDVQRAFVPIAGLHHASRSHAAGFCVFNDCGVVAEALKRNHGLTRIAYVDIDAHHGDGVYYGFEDDPSLVFADLHEDGRFLYPGTGSAAETGTGPARGTKLNIPLMPGSGDDEFFEAWQRVEAHLEQHQPQFVIFQCGADSLEGDPITHLRFSEEAHAHAATRLVEIAGRHARGRVLGLGGGGYNRRNLARAWSRVLRAFVEAG
ncbi:MAG: histone deacetylase [Gammaproteobacteria bacterium SG8_30]|nr:MAG: histone deacetylase [Gammaproteobacteria bacterium SG8_30]